MSSSERVISIVYDKVRDMIIRARKAYSQVMFLEGISINEVWKEVKKTVNSNYSYFATTPVDYELHRAELNIKLSVDEWEKLVLKRYNWLKERGEKIELHVHLASNLRLITYSEQKNKITKAYEWMRKNRFNPRSFIPGWWAWNQDTERIIGNLGLKLIKQHECRAIHDYELV